MLIKCRNESTFDFHLEEFLFWAIQSRVCQTDELATHRPSLSGNQIKGILCADYQVGHRNKISVSGTPKYILLLRVIQSAVCSGLMGAIGARAQSQIVRCGRSDSVVSSESSRGETEPFKDYPGSGWLP